MGAAAVDAAMTLIGGGTVEPDHPRAGDDRHQG